MAELRAPHLALAFPDFRITRPAQRVDQIAQNLFAFGRALFRHHRIGPLRASTLNEHKTGKENDDGVDWFQPHKTEPPFTLMTSPVMKLARSEATKRIGPATSSAVAALPRGITVDAIFWPAFVSSTAMDMSLATQPGATEFTRMFCPPNSHSAPLRIP